MTKEELMQYCRYYKGEEEIPFEKLEQGRSYFFWMAEWMWVKDGGTISEGMLALAVNCGLTDEQMLLNGMPRKFVDIPFSLRCYLFEEYCRQSYDDPSVLADYFSRLLNEYLSIRLA